MVTGCVGHVWLQQSETMQGKWELYIFPPAFLFPSGRKYKDDCVSAGVHRATLRVFQIAGINKT